VNLEPVYVITDQGPATGVGSYADAVYRLLHSDVPGLRVVYTGCNRLPAHDGWDSVPGAKVASRMSEVIPTLRYNYRRLRSYLPSSAVVHFCGIWYACVAEYRRSVAFIHDYYPRAVRIRSLSTPRSFFRDLSSLWQFLVLPRNVQRAAQRIVPTRYVQARLAHGAALDSLVIHHWVESDRFHKRDQGSARRTLGLPSDLKLALNVSAVTSNKGYETLSGVAENLPEGYRLVKLGGGLSGTRNVVNLSPLDDQTYPLLFNACDVYLHTSTEEGFGRPLLEAMSSALPAIAQRTEVSEEVLGDRAPLLPTDSSWKAWTATIQRLCNEEGRRSALEYSEKQLSNFGAESARELLTGVYRRISNL
jgi:glycosyltransferase involved in cell wall biosynthesis